MRSIPSGAAALARPSRLRIDAAGEPDNEASSVQMAERFILGRVARVALDCAGAESTALASVPHGIDGAVFRRRSFQPSCARTDSRAAIKSERIRHHLISVKKTRLAELLHEGILSEQSHSEAGRLLDQELTENSKSPAG
jgi:hypothetical protein